MAYDLKLAERVRASLQRGESVTERKMFGGLAFMLGGHMCCGVVNNELVLRLGLERALHAPDQPHIRPMDFTGRQLKGFVFVSPKGTDSDEMLRRLIGEAAEYVLSLPTKQHAIPF